ncbi:MAG TPA: D-alanyl-D-alanine carboxypeptidase/D-alanyl-D-alanine-endopeptidase [Candidatus Polarisedimenticolia bacterium]|nr:D-alanyl-D-alanine carboxypeptidase/D-alanyl-D-alanine-endopeptidase [Candidatus Polarisedimenticolia bacterium]
MQLNSPPKARSGFSIGPARVVWLVALLLVEVVLPVRAAEPSGAPASLPERLASLARTPALSPEDTGIAILLLPERRPIFMRSADRPLVPASTLKILTSASALALLKPEFVYRTRIFTDGPIDAAGALAGNLYVQGSGAPDLVGESWWLMARRLSALGLRRVDGDLVADESYFDAVRRPPGWPQPSADSWYNAPIGALSCNFNVVTVTVDPSPLLGARPDLTLEPAASFFQVLNRATTTAGPSSLSVSRSFENGRNGLVINGAIRRGGGPAVFNRAVEEPALYALHAFREIARSERIEMRGNLTVGTVPEKARELHVHESRPLGALVRDMNKNSNNFMAEMLVKTLGAQFAGPPGTTASGIEVVRSYIAGLGVDTSGLRLVDGSGLSDDDRVPARLLADVLARLWDDFEVGPELVSSLPIGGADGTLDERFGGEGSRRRVRAKTGRVAGALTLAGYVTNRDGRALAFVVLANRPRGTIETVHRAIDRLVDEVASSTDADLGLGPEKAPGGEPINPGSTSSSGTAPFRF